MKRALLVGNPNCGKTTLFNALTGSNQRVGNWPGVTVDRKVGVFNVKDESINLIDLPGVYSLVIDKKYASIDEKITAKEISSFEYDFIINVVDACNIERHLFLTSQLLELKKPMLIVLNMEDIAKLRGLKININAMQKALGVPVIPMQAHKSIGLTNLNMAISKLSRPKDTFKIQYNLEITKIIENLEKEIQKEHQKDTAPFIARRVLEGDTLLFSKSKLPALPADIDIVLADARYTVIHATVNKILTKKADASNNFTYKLDKIVLHKYFAFPIFFSAMYLMFFFAINLGGAFQAFFDLTSDAIFVTGLANLLNYLGLPNWFTVIFAYGIGKGVNTTLTFIPVIFAMFFFLSLLELSGYMARAAFVVDKVMRYLGLPGKAFVPMIVGFGCNVPAIMATRTIDAENERLLTVLMSPFMSCSARLAIYSVFVAAFFPTGGQNIVFSLYIIGILMAVLTGFLLRKTIFKGSSSPLIIELPAYHKPSLKRILKDTNLRLKHFVYRAFKLIIPVCMLLGILNTLSLDGSMVNGGGDSILASIGRTLTPLFAPMGIKADNWPATVGLLAGMLAKEVVVGTLNSLYSQAREVTEATAFIVQFDFWAQIKAAFGSIYENLVALKSIVSHPIGINNTPGELSQSAYGVMYSKFSGKIGAYAYLLFVLLYIPCVATMAAIRQETSRGLMWFSISWSLFVAYFTAVVFYQLATFSAHPTKTLLWIIAFVAITFVVVQTLKKSRVSKGGENALKSA